MNQSMKEQLQNIRSLIQTKPEMGCKDKEKKPQPKPKKGTV